MKLADYLEMKKNQTIPTWRPLCQVCLQSPLTCYCENINSFHPGIRFVILIHPLEFRRKVATGRMAHLCLQDSRLITGENYTNNLEVNQLLADPEYNSYLLYPTKTAVNLSTLNETEKLQNFGQGKKVQIFVIDGTWATARKTFRLSENIRSLPHISFSATNESRFKVRKQPKKICFSTIEAIHKTIDELRPLLGPRTSHREHDSLLNVFDRFVERQVGFVKKARVRLGISKDEKLRRRTA